MVSLEVFVAGSLEYPGPCVYLAPFSVRHDMSSSAFSPHVVASYSGILSLYTFQQRAGLTYDRMDTGIIGPVTVMAGFISRFGTQSAVVHGAIVSSILIPAALSGFLAGYVADLFGRPRCIALGALIFGFGAALEGGAVSLAMFVVGRCIEGFGEGLYLGTLTV